MQTVLLGTTNPSKRQLFRSMLSAYDAAFITLDELAITDEPNEAGSTPRENAEIKAAFYGRMYSPVLCNDAGLYISDLPLNDPRQPGLNIRAPQGERLNDERMIDYYAALVHTLGGSVSCYYVDGLAVCRDGRVSSYMDLKGARASRHFLLTDVPHAKRHPGWPLDSLSVNPRTGLYYMDADPTDEEAQILIGNYRTRMAQYLAQALALQPIA